MTLHNYNNTNIDSNKNEIVVDIVWDFNDHACSGASTGVMHRYSELCSL